MSMEQEESPHAVRPRVPDWSRFTLLRATLLRATLRCAALPCAALLLSACASPPRAAGALAGWVIDVTDGGTLKVLGEDHREYTVRLAGVAAPSGPPFAEQSRQHLAGQVTGRAINVEWRKLDGDGRIVGRVFYKTAADAQTPAADDPAGAGLRADAGMLQIYNGMAWHDRRHAPEQGPLERSVYEAVEIRACESKLGFWAGPHPAPPWESGASGPGGMPIADASAKYSGYCAPVKPLRSY